MKHADAFVYGSHRIGLLKYSEEVSDNVNYFRAEKLDNYCLLRSHQKLSTVSGIIKSYNDPFRPLNYRG